MKLTSTNRGFLKNSHHPHQAFGFDEGNDVEHHATTPMTQITFRSGRSLISRGHCCIRVRCDSCFSLSARNIHRDARLWWGQCPALENCWNFCGHDYRFRSVFRDRFYPFLSREKQTKNQREIEKKSKAKVWLFAILLL